MSWGIKTTIQLARLTDPQMPLSAVIASSPAMAGVVALVGSIVARKKRR